jgi:hypothetical protein
MLFDLPAELRQLIWDRVRFARYHCARDLLEIALEERVPVYCGKEVDPFVYKLPIHDIAVSLLIHPRKALRIWKPTYDAWKKGNSGKHAWERVVNVGFCHDPKLDELFQDGTETWTFDSEVQVDLNVTDYGIITELRTIKSSNHEGHGIWYTAKHAKCWMGYHAPMLQDYYNSLHIAV